MYIQKMEKFIKLYNYFIDKKRKERKTLIYTKEKWKTVE